MTPKDFDFRRIAERYKNRPFLHKQVIEQFRKDVTDQIFPNGLDIGCGAGLSSKALKLICRHVTGTDISDEMITVTKEISEDAARYGFLMHGQIQYEMEYGFDQNAFIEFMMIQSNVNAKIEGEGRTSEDVRRWFERSSSLLFHGEKRTVIFTGYSWYMERMP